MALTGDAIITRKLSVHSEPEFLRMIELIRDADVAFTNLEVLLHNYEPYPMHQSGGTWMRAEPEMARELTWAGIDIVSLANNHTGDYGVHGMRLTIQHVEEAGLVHAGAGESLVEAREARFIDISGARVALVSVASTFTEHSRAGKTRGDMPARPGLSPLRHSTTRIVSSDQLLQLRDLLASMGILTGGDSGRLRALGTRFEAGDNPAIKTTPNAEDMREIGAVVSNASRLSDYTIVSLHAHESAGLRSVPAEFLVTFAHTMVDAGADVVVGHGPHVLRGIEIFRGKPIFYSLGDFMFENETLLRLPGENYQTYDLGPDKHVADFNDARYAINQRSFPANREIWESVIALPRWVRGRPKLADSELARKIIDDLAARSERFGTEIIFRGGVGIVRVN
jgi:poly-gamma-glutamate synthesis protein (capsule biosynthesis protein)